MLLCPKWQKLAYGTDGAFITPDQWTLNSDTAAFDVAGIVAANVVWLEKPATSFRGGGELLAIDSLTSTSLGLRRLGLPAGAGYPPATVAGLTAVQFTVLSLGPQIEEASFSLNRQYMIDPGVPGRTAANIYDLRDLRQACVLTVICQRIGAELQDKTDAAWALKLKNHRAELDLTLGRLQLRWGNKGDSQPPSTLFSTRFVR